MKYGCSPGPETDFKCIQKGKVDQKMRNLNQKMRNLNKKMFKLDFENVKCKPRGIKYGKKSRLL